MSDNRRVVVLGWLPDPSENSLRSALVRARPDFATLPIVMTPRPLRSNPEWWSSSAILGEQVVVKYAWSERRAVTLWREGVVLERLGIGSPSLALPQVVFLTQHPVLLATRFVQGQPLSFERASALGTTHLTAVGSQIAEFLARLHRPDNARVVGDLPEVAPVPQTGTAGLRSRFGLLVDPIRMRRVMSWCEWVDHILAPSHVEPLVLVHGDFHGFNQIWDPGTDELLAVVDFEESGLGDPHYDFRYLPGNASTLDLTLATVTAYERESGRTVDLRRVMAWHVLTVLGDAMWRTEAGVPLPGGGRVSKWVDDVGARLAALDLDGQ
jgi:hypothetical protein